MMDARVRAAHDGLQLLRRTKPAPMPALHANWNVDLAHHDGLAVAHVAGVALDQIGAGVLAGGKPGLVVEDAAVAGGWGVSWGVGRGGGGGEELFFGPPGG